MSTPPTAPSSTPATQKAGGLGSLPEVPYQRLSEPVRSRLGMAALSIRAGEWKHAETTNFIYHYFNSFVATPVSVEAEFYYRVISQDLGKDTSKWQRKGHIYIFEDDADWDAFRQAGLLDPWTGGVHANNELFIQRNPQFRWQDSTLGHEIAHLVLDRFYSSAGVPLWLNEGYAEYIASVCYAAYYRSRGYLAKPRSTPLAPRDYLPLAELTAMVSYPPEPKVRAFYIESEKLVRYLTSRDADAFNRFLQEMSSGRTLASALSAAYGPSLTLPALEKEFKAYASKDYSPHSPR